MGHSTLCELVCLKTLLVVSFSVVILMSSANIYYDHTSSIGIELGSLYFILFSSHSFMVLITFSEIPAMSRPPRQDSRTETSISIRWRSWQKPIDSGDGPVDAYIVYYRAKGESSWQSMRLNDLSATLTDLAVDTQYAIKISPIHRQGFEGFPSPELNVSTCGSKYDSSLLTLWYFAGFACQDLALDEKSFLFVRMAV